MSSRTSRSLALLLTSALIAAPIALLPASLVHADEEATTTSESTPTEDASSDEQGSAVDVPAGPAETPAPESPVTESPVTETPDVETPSTDESSTDEPAVTETPAPAKAPSRKRTTAAIAAVIAPPTAPLNLRATTNGSTTSISWDAPADAGSSPLASYLVEYSFTDDGNWYTLQNSATTQTTYYSWSGLVDWRVTAITADGRSPYATLDSVSQTAKIGPSKPTGVTGTPTGTSIDLSWTAPTSTGGAALSSYSVRYRQSSASVWTTLTTTSTSQLITSLQFGATYVIQVRATSSIGSSRWTDAQSVTTLSVPSIITDLSAVASVGYATLDWTAPAAGASAILGYDVQYRAAGGSWTQFGRITETDATIASLLAGTAYEFQARAVNAQGPADWSASAAVTIPAVPSTISDLVATRSDESVVLEWSEPAPNGSSITGYELRYRSDVSYTTVVLGLVTTTTILDLPNGVEQQFEIRAINEVGAGEWSGIESATPAGAPGSIREFTSTPIADGVTLTWEAPSDNGGSLIIGYEIGYRLAGSTNAYITIETTDPTTTITDLGNDITYEARVRVESEAGFGDWTEQGIFTAGNVPSAPRDVTLRGGDASITVSWTAPAFQGGTVITDYEVTVTDAATEAVVSTTQVTGTSTTVTGLTNSALYEVSVRALNGRVAGSWSAPDSIYAFTFDASFTTEDGKAVTTVAPGDTIVVSGSGTLPDAGVFVELHSDPIALGSTTVTEAGTFSLTVTIPKNAPAGKHTLYAGLGMGGGLISEFELGITVTAVATADGDSLAITGIDQNSLALTLWFALGATVLGTTLLVTRRRRASK